MEKHNLSDNVQFAGRVLHLQTHTLNGGKRIVSTLFDRGKVIDQRDRNIDVAAPPEIVRSTVESIHHTRKQDIHSLDRIMPTIKQIRHGPSLFRLGRLLLAWHFYDDARSVLESAGGDYPETPEKALLLSEIDLRLNQYHAAERLIRQAVCEAPENLNLRLQLGWIYHRMSESGQAEDAIREAFRINPDSPAAHLFWGIHQLRELAAKKDSARSGKTMESLKKAVSLSPAFRRKTITEAIQHIDTGDHGSALDILEGVYDRAHLSLPADSDFFFLYYLYGEGKRDGAALRRFQAWIHKELSVNPGQGERLDELAMIGLVQAHGNLRNVLEILEDAGRYREKRTALPVSREEVSEIYLKTGELLKQYFKRGG